jgi:hypothetical protein
MMPPITNENAKHPQQLHTSGKAVLAYFSPLPQRCISS